MINENSSSKKDWIDSLLRYLIVTFLGVILGYYSSIFSNLEIRCYTIGLIILFGTILLIRSKSRKRKGERYERE